MTNQHVTHVNRYTDVVWPLVFKDVGGDPMDLTGWTASIVDRTDNDAFQPAVTITDAANGVAEFSVPWDDALPDNVLLSCRIRIQLGAQDTGYPPINLVYQ